jgi:hypothetical protein
MRNAINLISNGMNTKYLIGAVVIVLVAVGVYMAMQSNAPIQQGMTDQMQNRMSMRHSLRDFMTMPGESMKCTHSYTDAETGTVTEGTTYVANGKVRSDSTVTRGSDVMTSSSIVDGEMMYAWGSDMPHGMKVSLSALSNVSADAEGGVDTMGMSDRAEGVDTEYDYTCEPWSGGASFFAPPAGVEFMDYSEMMQGMGGMMMNMQGGADAGMNAGAGGNAMMCAACEQAPDAESKAQCKAALGCE